jgi:hypothetical protein
MVTKFMFRAQVVRWIDADTVLVDPHIYPRDVYLRVRLKDRWEPEIGEVGEDAAREAAMRMFPIRSTVVLTNNHVKWTYGRLEARVDTYVHLR